MTLTEIIDEHDWREVLIAGLALRAAVRGEAEVPE